VFHGVVLPKKIGTEEGTTHLVLEWQKGKNTLVGKKMGRPERDGAKGQKGGGGGETKEKKRTTKGPPGV